MASRCCLLSVVAVACLILACDRAWAQGTRQERLFVVVPGVSNPHIYEVDTSVAGFGRILSSRPLTVPFAAQSVWQPVSGGRLLVGTNSFRLHVFDTRQLVGADFPVEGDLLAVDTHRPRVFLSGPPAGFPPFINQLKIVDLGTGVISFVPMGPWAYLSQATYAGLTERLFLQSHTDQSIVNVVDVGTRTVVQSIDLQVDPPDSVRAMVTDMAGSRLFVLTSSTTTVTPAQLTVFDVATGCLIKRIGLGDLFRDTAFGAHRFQALRLDEERQRLLVGTLAVLDANTLEFLGATLGVPGGARPVFAFTGPRSPFISFSSQQLGGRYPGEPVKCVVAQLERRSAVTGALEAAADIGAATTLTTSPRRFVGCSTAILLATVPRPAQRLVSAVNGRRVTLWWVDPGNTTHFDVEAGSAHGLANLMSRSVSGTTFTVDDVPSGRYYVRVRAINDVGRSVPTADVEIIVPN
jgi:hypothetical protein